MHCRVQTDGTRDNYDETLLNQHMSSGMLGNKGTAKTVNTMATPFKITLLVFLKKSSQMNLDQVSLLYGTSLAVVTQVANR